MSDQLFSFNRKSLLLFALLLASGLAMFHFVLSNTQEPVAHQLVVAGIGLLANFGIVYYHLTRPPHPKFLMIPERKLMVRLHAYLGMAEIITGVACFFTQNIPLGLLFAGLSVLHASTSFYQTPAVFGAKAVMIPSYFFVSALHLYCGIRLFFAPTDPTLILDTFLVLNIYAYVRLYMVIFEKTGLFRQSHYSASVLFAGFTVMPSIMGPAFFVSIFGYFVLYLLFCKLIFGLDKAQMQELFHEKVREGLIDDHKKHQWLAEHLGAGASGAVARVDAELAERIFRKLDENNDGQLNAEELSHLLTDWGMSKDALSVIQLQANGPISFDVFLGLLQSSAIVSNDFKRLKKQRNLPEKEQAKIIFSEIDFDQSGYIETYELELLLLEYGLPKKEITQYMRRHDRNGDGRISFEEFHQSFAPLWRFAYSL